MEKKIIGIFTAFLIVILTSLSGQTAVFAQENAESTSDVESADLTLIAGSEDKEVKEQEEEVIEQIETGEALLLMADADDIVTKAGLSRASKSVSLVRGDAVYYENWITHYFYINGNLAYCLEPSAGSPGSGEYAATVLDNNKLLSKALYYLVGGPGYTSALEKQFFPNTVGNTAVNYCYSHVVLSYIYDNCSTKGDAFQGVSSTTIQQVINITETIRGLDAAPDAELSISPDSQESTYVKGTGTQKTGNFKLTGDKSNHITVTLPQDVSIYNHTTDKTSTGKVKIYGGDKFYFTAPTTVTGTWKTEKLSGSITNNYKALIINEGDTTQTVGGWSYTIAEDVKPVSFSVKWLDWGKLKIKKVSSDTNATADGVDDNYYSLKGAKFEIRDSSGKVMETLVTDEKGEATSGLLPYAPYKLVEITPPTGYLIAVESTVEVETSLTEFTVKEQPQYGKIELQKKSGDTNATADGVDDSFYTLAGAVYEIFNSKGTVVDTITTDTAGKASSKNLSLGKYTVKEKAGSPSKGYLVDTKTYEVEITSENRTSTVFVKSVISTEIPQYGSIALKKLDSETKKNEPQGAASLEKATYEIYNSAGKLVETLVTDNKGEATSGKHPLGNYTVKETISSEGYLLDQNTYSVKIESTDRVTQVFVKGVTSVEDIIRGDVQIVKFRESKDEDEELKTPLKGIQFTFTSKTTNKVVRTITTDADGYATTADKEHPRGGLVYDTYVVKEVKETVPEGVKVIEPFEVTISEEGITHYYIAEDKNIVSPITVVKKDLTTGEIVPIAGTEFRLLNAQKEPVTMTTYYPDKVVHETFKTDANGQFTLPEKVDYGTYYLEEVQAPHGYLKGELLEIKIEESHKWDEPFVVEYFDEPAMGKIIIHKTDFDTEGNVEGAEFTVTAKEDIITGDETVRLKAGEVAAVITTDRNGVAKTDKLYLGLYEVEETKVPEGYVKPISGKEVELKYEGQEVTLVREVIEVVNHPTKIKLTKVKQGDDKTVLSGVKFAFWEKTNDTAVSNPEKEDLVTDENGEIILKYLHPGTYCFQEIATLPGYLLDDTIHEITIDENGYVDGKMIGILKIENDFTKVDISKKEITSEQEIKGAELEVIDSDGKVVDKWTSGEEPHRIEALAPGDYILKESLVPLGYLAAEQVSFTVTETGEVQSVVMYDEIPMGQVAIHKTDAQTKKALAGVEYELLDEDGKVLETLTTDKSGKAVSQLYQIGMYENGKFVSHFKYSLIETKALEGYQLDQTVYEVVFEYVDENTPIIEVGFELTNQLILEETEVETEKETEKKEAVSIISGSAPTGTNGKSGTSTTTSSVKTGDNAPLFAFAVVLVVSGGTAGLLLYKKKKKK